MTGAEPLPGGAGPGADVGGRERELRALMVEVGRWMWQRGHVAGTDGNLSARLPDGRVVATPAGVAKGRLQADDLVVTDLAGRVVSGSGIPSSELKLHLAVYRARPDVGAVVHAHPKAAVAHSLAGVSLAQAIIPETVVTLGTIAAARYATPGSASLASAVEAMIRDHDAIIMERHGSVTVGADLEQAYNRLESLEHAAEILVMARALGQVEPLPTAEVERLVALAGRSHPADRRPAIDEALVRRLVQAVLERLEAPR